MPSLVTSRFLPDNFMVDRIASTFIAEPALASEQYRLTTNALQTAYGETGALARVTVTDTHGDYFRQTTFFKSDGSALSIDLLP